VAPHEVFQLVLAGEVGSLWGRGPSVRPSVHLYLHRVECVLTYLRANYVVFKKVQRHYVTQPNVTRPNVTRPNVTRPNVTRPNVTRPNVTRPNVTFTISDPMSTDRMSPVLNVTQPNVTFPNVTSLECHLYRMSPFIILNPH
jgi:hypothetical protein